MTATYIGTLFGVSQLLGHNAQSRQRREDVSTQNRQFKVKVEASHEKRRKLPQVVVRIWNKAEKQKTYH